MAQTAHLTRRAMTMKVELAMAQLTLGRDNKLWMTSKPVAAIVALV